MPLTHFHSYLTTFFFFFWLLTWFPLGHVNVDNVYVDASLYKVTDAAPLQQPFKEIRQNKHSIPVRSGTVQTLEKQLGLSL